MATLLEQLLYMTEADDTDKDTPDNTENSADVAKETKDVQKDDKAEDPPTDDADPPTEDAAPTDDADPPADGDNADDPADTSDSDKLDSDVSNTLSNVDWEKKLFITSEFEEIHTTYSNLEKFVSSAILQINYSNSIEKLLRSILEKINFNLVSLNNILEGNLLIDLEYKSLEKLLEIYSKDIENITDSIKLIKSDSDEKGKDKKK